MERINGPPVLVRTFFLTLDDVIIRLVRATLALLHASQIWVNPNILPIIRRAMERAFLGAHLNIKKKWNAYQLQSVKAERPELLYVRVEF